MNNTPVTINGNVITIDSKWNKKISFIEHDEYYSVTGATTPLDTTGLKYTELHIKSIDGIEIIEKVNIGVVDFYKNFKKNDFLKMIKQNRYEQ